MLIPPKYTLTPKIMQLLSSIEASREVINSVQIPPAIEQNIRRVSTLKSSLFSARIEGNTLTLEELSSTSSREQKKREVFNILKALNWIRSRGSRDLSLNDVLKIHSMVTAGLAETENQGKFRREVSAIFNAQGYAVYMPPPPKLVPALINKLLKFVNSPKEQFIPIRATLAHFAFEKIHPFMDGNGRTGRLLIQAILERGGYGMKGLVSLEEYLDNHRSLYYQVLEDKDRDTTEYLEFMLEALSVTAEKAREEVLKKQQTEASDYLLPRRGEIYNIIKEHKLVNFDMLRRRFAKINERTLRFDLKKLADQGLIRKLGSTRGVYYEAF